MPSKPKRWDKYSNIGEVIEGTRFIPFKAPLKETISVPGGQKFTPTRLLKTLKERNLKLGLLIDLTNTDKYTDRTEFEKNGVLYEKISVKGHKEARIPEDTKVESFCNAVDSFLEKNADGLIGVHCTHGVNRTGYMVCRYMIEKGIKDPEEAIKDFRSARGYSIEIENYLKDLRRRRGGGRPHKRFAGRRGNSGPGDTRGDNLN